ncbi:hypothetical protein ACGFYQ_33955 [Streptomyces sp. NPDC048258]|uniref:hypothetical protein n=1 Tax=Streptomyces sp. NPDC048258 TaxID=3365527 RepID=UPI0037194152
MPQARRKATDPAGRTLKLELAPKPQVDDPAGPSQAKVLLDTLTKISRQGGLIASDGEKQDFNLLGGKYFIAESVALEDNLWRLNLPLMAHHLLSHFKANHDPEGQTKVTQAALGVHFGCHHSKINRALKALDSVNLAWKARQGLYQLHPGASYRWGSRRQRALVEKLAPVLKDRPIVIPMPEMRKP